MELIKLSSEELEEIISIARKEMESRKKNIQETNFEGNVKFIRKEINYLESLNVISKKGKKKLDYYKTLSRIIDNYDCQFKKYIDLLCVYDECKSQLKIYNKFKKIYQ